jgi:hypothetical protein
VEWCGKRLALAVGEGMEEGTEGRRDEGTEKRDQGRKIGAAPVRKRMEEGTEGRRDEGTEGGIKGAR